MHTDIGPDSQGDEGRGAQGPTKITGSTPREYNKQEWLCTSTVVRVQRSNGTHNSVSRANDPMDLGKDVSRLSFTILRPTRE